MSHTIYDIPNTAKNNIGSNIYYNVTLFFGWTKCSINPIQSSFHIFILLFS